MKLLSAISVGRTAVPVLPPPKLTFPSSSSYLRRVFKSISPPFHTVVIRPRNACCYSARRPSSSDSTGGKPTAERVKLYAKEEPNFEENMSIMPNFGWRWLLGLSTIPSLLVLLFYRQVPESPRYLHMKRKLTEARYTLDKVDTLNRNDKLVSAHINDADSVRSSSISMLLSPNLIRTTLPIWFLYFGNTFSYYGIILLTSQLSMGQSESIQNSSLYTNVFVNSLAELPGLGLAAIILDKLGRKISMEIMFVAGFVLLLPLVVHQNEMLTATSLFGARMFISASFIVACIYSPEVYPTNVRATGVGIATAVGRTGGMVCPLVAIGLVNSCSQTLAVMLFEVMILVSGLCVVLLPLETKGRELTDEVE